MEIKMNIDLDLERKNFEASGICTKSMFENVMWDQWLFKYVPLVREKKICDNAIKINDRFLGWKAAKSQATPEGFVLVLKQPTNEIILKGCGEVADCTSTEEMERAYKTMIEAQEQSHD